LHCDAALEVFDDARKKSKCPFCRQVLGFEEEDYEKIITSHENLIQIRNDCRQATRKLQQLNGWIYKMSRLRIQLECKLKAENKL
jgi:hypothetical protein